MERLSDVLFQAASDGLITNRKWTQKVYSTLRMKLISHPFLFRSIAFVS